MKIASLMLVMALGLSAQARQIPGGPTEHVLPCRSTQNALGVSLQFVYTTQALAPQYSVRSGALISKVISPSAKPQVRELEVVAQTAKEVHFVPAPSSKSQSKAMLVVVLNKSQEKASVFVNGKLTSVCSAESENN